MASAPVECVKCGSPTGPVIPIEAEWPGWLCPTCYSELQEEERDEDV
jgi:hypothetical protein